MLQKRIIRISTKETFNAHTDPIFSEVKILKFEKIHLYQLGKFMYLYRNNLLPKSFENLFIRMSQVHNYNTYVILTCITSPFAEQTLENSQLVTKPRHFLIH
jgi:hypothetical protein